MLPAIESLSVTERLLLRLLSVDAEDPDPNSDEWAQVDWLLLLDMMKYHRVVSLVAPRLLALDKTYLPKSVANQVLSQTREASLASLKKMQATMVIASAFEVGGVQALLMKSEAVSLRFYENPSARFANDIDYLIAPEDFQKAAIILEELGYEQSKPDRVHSKGAKDALIAFNSDVTFTNHASPMVVELHWRLFSNPKLLPLTSYQLEFDIDKIKIGQREIRVLNLPLQLVYLVCHGAIHSWFRWKWIADIDRMLAVISNEDLEQAKTLATQFEVQEIFDAAINLRNHLFGRKKSEPVGGVQAAHLERYMAVVSQRRLLRTRSFSELGNVVAEFRALLRIHRGISYKLWVWIDFFVHHDDFNKLNLSRRWGGLYVITGAIRKLKSTVKQSRSSSVRG